MTITHQNERLRNTVRNAIEGATYKSSQLEDDGRSFLLNATRGAKDISLRFRGVKTVSAINVPEGAPLRLKGVGSTRSVLLSLLPMMRGGANFGEARVRIDAGATRLDIVCQDAEWWEE